MINDQSDYLKVLKSIVLVGGLNLNAFRGMVKNVPKKSDLPSEKVQESSTAHTEVDDLGQELGLEILYSHFPDVSINVEEETPRKKLFSTDKTKICFHFDPLDGTLAYVKGRDDFSIGAAFSDKLEFKASAIYFPSTDRLYLSEKGKGVRLQNSLGKELGFKRPEKPENNYLQKRCEKYVPIMKKMGLEPLDLMSAHHAMVAIAEGKAKVQMYNMASPHDFGIPQVLVEEAGGICTDLEGKKIEYDENFNRLSYFLSFYDLDTKKEFFDYLEKI